MARKASAIRASNGRALYRTAVSLLWIVACGGAGPAIAQTAEGAPPKRIVSINACTDQLVFALADRDQIAALTRYAVRKDYSIYVEQVKASGIKLIRGSAEEVLKLKPDLVLAGTYTRRATRQMLQRLGVKLELFPPVDNIAETEAAIRKAAGLFGHADRGEALIEEIDHALAVAPDLRARRLAVLQLQRRGFVSGPETLVGDLLQKLGVANAAARLGIRQIGRASLETALKAREDALLLFDPSPRASDQGTAMLLHPALRAIYPPERRISLPGRLAICGGPALPLAVAELTKSLQQISPRLQRR